ncbi:hypothetical protein MMC25_008197 [Agyrium rufum]|nr:hypothetical protein [Agyrium rufum]
MADTTEDPRNTPVESKHKYPQSFGIALFPAFEPIDVFGSAEVIDNIGGLFQIKLAIIAETLDPVSNRPKDQTLNTYNSSVWQHVVPTHTFANPPSDLEVLIIPGGIGTFYPRQSTVNFIKHMYPKVKYLMTICSGSMLAAKSGILDGKQATTNKATWSTAIQSGPKVDWVPKARWVVDTNIWTSSGETAGIDSMLGFVECLYGNSTATTISNNMEYERHTDPIWDPFSAIWNVTQP